MNILYKEPWFEINEIHPNEYFLLRFIVSKMYETLDSTTLENFTDERDKEDLKKRIERIIKQFNEHAGSKTAESKDEGLIKKVLEHLYVN